MQTITIRRRHSPILFAHVLFAKVWPHSSHLNSWQSLPPSTRPCAAVPHSGQILQVASAPSRPRTFSFVNTAGAVPGEASAARNIARSYSLRERGLVIVVPLSIMKRLTCQNHEIARRCRLDLGQGGEMCFVPSCLRWARVFSARRNRYRSPPSDEATCGAAKWQRSLRAGGENDLNDVRFCG
jgi:hypothetical protein